MRTVVLGPPPPEITALMERRRQSGLDQYDEVWHGEYHMAPMAHSSHGRLQAQLMMLLGGPAADAGLVITGPFNLGAADDFRVPDLGLHRGDPDAVWVPTAALVGEVESPDDETWDKLPFYAARGVDEVVVVSPAPRSVVWLTRQGNSFAPASASAVVELTTDQLASHLDWP